MDLGRWGHCSRDFPIGLRNAVCFPAADWKMADYIAPTGTAATFPSTHWPAIAVARDADPETRRKALGELLVRYEVPLTRYLSQKFHCSEDQARDLFQGFVAEVVLKRDLIGQARPIPGRQFRSYLLTALHQFAVSEHRRETAQKRQPEGGMVPLDDVTASSVPAPNEVAAVAFDVAWARGVLNDAIQGMRLECEESKRPDLWGVFERRLLAPILEGVDPLPYDQLIERFHLESPTRAHNVLVTAKRMFARCLRAAVSQYVAGEADIEGELRELRAILAQAK